MVKLQLLSVLALLVSAMAFNKAPKPDDGRKLVQATAMSGLRKLGSPKSPKSSKGKGKGGSPKSSKGKGKGGSPKSSKGKGKGGSPKSSKGKGKGGSPKSSKGKGKGGSPKSPKGKGKGGSPKGKGKGGSPKGKGKGGSPKGKGKGGPVPSGKGGPVPSGKGGPVPSGKGGPVPSGKGGPVPSGKDRPKPKPSGKGGPVPSGKGGPPAGKGKGAGSNCMTMPIVFNTDEILAAEYSNSIGFGLGEVPFYDATTGEQLGTYSDFAVEIKGSDECIATGAFSLDLDATTGLYGSQINLAFTCTSEFNTITGGNGAFGCASGMEVFAFEDIGVLGTELVICSVCTMH